MEKQIKEMKVKNRENTKKVKKELHNAFDKVLAEVSSFERESGK